MSNPIRQENLTLNQFIEYNPIIIPISFMTGVTNIVINDITLHGSLDNDFYFLFLDEIPYTADVIRTIIPVGGLPTSYTNCIGYWKKDNNGNIIFHNFVANKKLPFDSENYLNFHILQQTNMSQEINILTKNWVLCFELKIN